jgi:hypothetical protein
MAVGYSFLQFLQVYDLRGSDGCSVPQFLQVYDLLGFDGCSVLQFFRVYDPVVVMDVQSYNS